MKKIFLVAVFTLLVLCFGFTEGTTWNNPDESPFLDSITLPRSMLSAVSNGIYYDEIDTLILSPAELSNYSGYSIITGYGNYEYDYQGATPYPNTWVNPFTTTSLNQDSSPDNIGNFLLGVTGELFGYRGGVIASIVYTTDMRLDVDGDTNVDASVWSDSETVTVDDDTDGTVDYTYTNAQSYTDYSTSTVVNMGAGVDLNILGASLYGSFEKTSNHLGGSYVYTKAINADADSAGSVDPVDVVTSKTVTFGYGEGGKVKNNPLFSNSNWVFGVRGHLPLEIADMSMPVKADFYFGSKTPSLPGSISPKATFDLTAVNVTADDVAESSTILAVYGESAIDGIFDPDANVGTVYSGTDSYNQAAFRTMISNVQGGVYAYDPSNSSNINFKTGLKGLIDPEITVSDVFSLRTRGQLGYEFDITSQKISATKSVTYNEALVGQSEKAVYSYSETAGLTAGATVNTVDMEIGGIMDLHNRENTVGVACGLFYQPEFKFTKNTIKDSQLVATVSYTDPSGATPDASAIGQTVGYGVGEVQGSQVITQVNGSYEDDISSKEFALTNNLYIPASVRVAFSDGAFELVGGYLLKHDNSLTNTKNYDQSAGALTTTLTSVGGTSYDTPASESAANTVSTGNTKTLADNGEWSGQMSFMLRWNVKKGLKVDFFGATIMQALDFDILGGANTVAGFNPYDFIDSLGISVTISAE